MLTFTGRRHNASLPIYLFRIFQIYGVAFCDKWCIISLKVKDSQREIEMSVLSDTIEQFIKDLMNEYEGKIELQRNELAQHFNCAPSQINYVLATRFTPDKGYIIESRRGGGGYIRVLRLSVETSEHLFRLVTTRIGEEISERDAHDVICRLVESDSIKKREGALMKAAVSDKALNIPAMLKDKIRASILKQMLLVLLSKEAE